jgi:hypothetical protein
LSRIPLNHNPALDRRDLLPGHDVRHAVEMRWDQIGNGELLTIAEAAGFEIVITADQNIRYQQNLSGRRLTLMAGWTSAGSASLLTYTPSFCATLVSSVSILVILAV